MGFFLRFDLRFDRQGEAGDHQLIISVCTSLLFRSLFQDALQSSHLCTLEPTAAALER